MMAYWFGPRPRGSWRCRDCGDWNDCTDAACDCERGEDTTKTDIYTAPAEWACALVNGDYSGLDANEAAACRAWQESILPARVVATEGLPRFTSSYRLYGGLYEGGDVLDYQTLETA